MRGSSLALNCPKFVTALFAVTALRLWAACSIPLSGDEAYYWTWTQHPAAGYHDHPPMVAWLVAASTYLFGATTGTVRLPFVLCGAGVAWLSFILGWTVSRDVRVACWTGGIVLIMPLFTLAGVAVFPDSPLLLACVAFFVCALRAVEGGHSAPLAEVGAGSPAWWAAGGVAAGLAGLSKLTGLYLIPAFFFFLVLSPRRRPLLGAMGPWMLVAVALAVLAPFIHWNLTHGFESLAYQYSSRLGEGRHRQFFTPTFLAFSAVAASPILFVLMVWSVLRAGWDGWRKDDDSLLFLFCMAVPLPAAFLACSFVTKVGIHWTAPAALAASGALGAWLAPVSSVARRGWVGVGAALSVLISSMVYWFALSPGGVTLILSNGLQMTGINHGKPLKTSEITEIVGYPEAGKAVRRLAQQMRSHGSDPFLITTNYALSSALWFYSGETFHVIMGSAIGAQYDHWDDFSALRGRDALYIDTSPVQSREDVWRNLHAAFERVTLEPPFVTFGRGVEARTFYVARCDNFRDDVFTALQSIHRLTGNTP